MALNYRKDIDGLRGLSIVLVIIFHAFEKLLPSGFIGVDLFFVISGFVISGVIDQDYRHGRFSLLRFYEKRIRRIYPALLLVLVAVSVFAWQSLFADELKQLGQHLIGSAFFVSNFILYAETGYFDNAAATKPLLHLWSLAVEEQFYIVWPLILVLLLKQLRAKISSAILVFVLLFYVVQVVYVQYDREAAFYLPFNRAWELAIGALAYFSIGQHRFDFIAPWLQTLLALVLLVLALVLIDNSNFPGWIAALPVLAAFGILISPANRLKSAVFENRLLVFTGTISYPLYLWHWPVLSYLHIVKGENLSKGLIIAGLAVAVILAYLTYRLLEHPIRFGVFKSSKVAPVLLVLMLVMAAIGYSAVINQGYKQRQVAVGNLGFVFVNTKDMGYSPCPSTVHAPADSPIDYCYQGKPGTVDSVILGDSHAEDKFWGLVDADVDHNWMLLGSTNCPFLAADLLDQACQTKTLHILNWLKQQPQIKTVVIAFFMNKWLGLEYPKTLDVDQGELPYPQVDKQRWQQMQTGLATTLELLIQQGKQVTVLIDVPQLPFNPKSCSRSQIECRLSLVRMERDQTVIRETMVDLQQRFPELNVFDPKQWMCDEQFCAYQHDHDKIYRDQDHLTPLGSQLYARALIPSLRFRELKQD